MCLFKHFCFSKFIVYVAVNLKFLITKLFHIKLSHLLNISYINSVILWYMDNTSCKRMNGLRWSKVLKVNRNVCTWVHLVWNNLLMHHWLNQIWVDKSWFDVIENQIFIYSESIYVLLSTFWISFRFKIRSRVCLTCL